MSERKKFILIVLAFLAAYCMPLGSARIQGAVFEAFARAKQNYQHKNPPGHTKAGKERP